MTPVDGIDRLLKLNAEHSKLFVDAGTALERRFYREQHPTEIAVLKCMDGRLHLPVMTNTALGIIQSWRNLGGTFDLGWLGFQQSIESWKNYAMSKGRYSLVIATYHYARGEAHRGCRGFNYDRKEAERFSSVLKSQFDRVYGRKILYTIQMGIETDWDALILHGENGEVVDLGTVADDSHESLLKMLKRLYPEMPERIVLDFLPLVKGNIAHTKAVQESHRPTQDAEHKEWVLGVGRGFDWLHEINTAFIIGPFDPNLERAIATGATLLLDNIKSGRVNHGGGAVLMASAPYRNPAGEDQGLAREKALFLQKFASDAIAEKVPELKPYLQHLTVTVDMNTRAVNVL